MVSSHYVISQKRARRRALDVKNQCPRTVSGSYKATPVWSGQAEVGITPPHLHKDGRQVRFWLMSAGSGIDREIRAGILKVRQFLSCIRPQPTCPRASRNWQTASNPRPPTLPASDPILLATSQLFGPSNGSPRMTPDALLLFWQGQTTKSTLFGCSSNSLQPKALPTPIWLRPPGTNVLKLHEGLVKAESSLAIQLRTGTNGLDAFLFKVRVTRGPGASTTPTGLLPQPTTALGLQSRFNRT